MSLYKNNCYEVEPYGPKDSSLIILVDSVSEKDSRREEPLSGMYGTLIQDYITKSGIKEKPLIIPLIRLPIFRDNTTLITKNPTEYQRWKDALTETLESLPKKPRVIVPLGNLSLDFLLGLNSIMHSRGSCYPLEKFNAKVAPIFHPQQIFQNSTLAPVFAYDWAMVAQHIKNPTAPANKDHELILHTGPNFDEVIDFLNRCEKEPILAWDIETSMRTEEFHCVGIALSPTEAMCIPFNNDYFTFEKEIEIWKRLGKILSNKNQRHVAHNAMFDCTYIQRKYGIRVEGIEDTMVAMALLFPYLPSFIKPKSLYFLTSIFTEMPYYKDDGKEQNKGAGKIKDWTSYYRYNAKDCVACFQGFIAAKRELQKMGNWEAYQKQTSLIRPLIDMGTSGIKIDVKAFTEYRYKMRETLDAYKLTLTQALGIPNINSTKQLKEVLYKNRKPYTKNGRPTVDTKALKQLSANGVLEADMLLRYREVEKLHSTYLHVILPNERLLSGYNVVGTAYGRFSSSQTIFGEGMNIQNQPFIIKTFMKVDDGYTGYEIDLSAAENRIVAYLGQDDRMMHAFENKIDMHSLTASLVFGIPLDQVSDEEGSSELGKGDRSQRFWGKKCNHAFNYGMSAFHAMREFEIPLREAKFLYNSYHSSYPGVKYFWRWVQEQLKTKRYLQDVHGKKIPFHGLINEELLKSAYSAFPQSSIVGIINNGILFLEKNYPDVVKLNQVHDSFAIEIPNTYTENEKKKILQEVVKILETPIVIRGKEVSIPADVKQFTDNFSIGIKLNVFS